LRRLESSTLAGRAEWGAGILARSRALLAEGSEAEALYEEAIDHLQHCRVRPELARAHLLYGEWLRRRRRRVDARAQLRAAHQMLASMGADGFAGRAEVELLASGERVHTQGPDAVQRLTPREERIAWLASEGASNQEIAIALFISPRTVEYHLHKVFRELAISSRTQLGAALRRMREAGPTAEE
jgi:DNA-binding CsgD family transcriptional regulator